VSTEGAPRPASGDGFEALFRLSPFGIVVSTLEGVMLDANDAVHRIFGFARGEMVGRTSVDLGILSAEARAQSFALLRRDGFVRDLELTVRAHSGEARDVLVSIDRVQLGAVERYITTFVDLTERKRTEARRRSAEAKFSGFLEAAPDAIVITGIDGAIVQINAQTEKLFGHPRDELVGAPIERLIPARLRDAHRRHRAGYLSHPKARAMGSALELFGLRKDGSEFAVEVSLSPLETEDGTLVCSAIRDITARKDAETALRHSLAEKEVLLQEVHHRVKNNLQVIASLINMQRRNLENETARRALEECGMRVLAIAQIHETLYQSKDYGRVPFHDYIRSIAANVFGAGGIVPGNVQLELAITPVSLPVDKAIPCGLIVNELITNAMKHAFPGGRGGTIRVALSAGGGEVRLCVADDGVGLPPGFDRSAPRTLGMQLISTLADQLEATLEVESDGGAAFRLAFAAAG